MKRYAITYSRTLAVWADNEDEAMQKCWAYDCGDENVDAKELDASIEAIEEMGQ